jgi:hypothetical protein
VIYQHPLAYLLGLEGIALLRAFAGEYDRDFTTARLDEVRALLDSVEELGDGTAVRPIPTTEAYHSWAEFYDEPGNQLIDLEQPIVREILDGLPRGVALDAAPRRPFPLVDDGDLRSATGDVFPDHAPGAPPNIWALHRWVYRRDQRCVSRQSRHHHLALPARLSSTCLRISCDEAPSDGF